MRFLSTSLVLLIAITLCAQSSYYELANLKLGEGDIDSARYYINKSLARKPTADDYFLSGMIHEAEGKALRAIADYEAVINYDEYHLEAFFQKGLIYYNQNNPKRAISDFTHVLLNQSSAETNAVYYGMDQYGEGNVLIATLSSMLGKVYQYRGLSYVSIGERENAIKDFERARSYGETPEFYVNRGQLYEELGEKHRAEADYKKCIELDRLNKSAWYNLAVLDPATVFPSDLELDASFTPMINLLGATAIESGNYQLAASYLTNAVDNDAADALTFVNRGKALMKLSSYNQARQDFLKAIQMDRNMIDPIYLIGNTYFFQKKYNDALGFYEQFLSIDGSYDVAWYNAAMAYMSISDKKNACRCLTQAMSLSMDRAKESFDQHCKSQ